jgi:plasmid maintenance system antidote protein VapI
MRSHAPVSIEGDNPNHMHLEDDSALAHKLKVAPNIVTMMREGRISVSASMLIWMREASGMSLQQLRKMLKDQRASYHLTCK